MTFSLKVINNDFIILSQLTSGLLGLVFVKIYSIASIAAIAGSY